MVGPRERATRMPADERRAAIIDAVLPLLETHGEVSTRQIAEAAGIAEGTIFRAFPDKRSLFLAAAERAVAPEGWREDMAARAEVQPTLEAKVLEVTAQLVDRSHRVMLVLGALRRVLMEGSPEHRPSEQKGPPAFFTESSRQLHDALVALVFAPHRDELGVSPERAARALQSLVTGAWHPGALTEERLLPEEITWLCLHGCVRHQCAPSRTASRSVGGGAMTARADHEEGC